MLNWYIEKAGAPENAGFFGFASINRGPGDQQTAGLQDTLGS